MLRKYCIQYEKHTLISIEGNIGSGKSTLLRLMKERYNQFEFIAEPVQEWQQIRGDKNLNLLKQFYEQPQRWAYTMQVYAFYSRLKYWKQILKQIQEQQKIILSERSIESDKEIFAINGYESGLINNLEYALYEQFYDWLVQEIFGEDIQKQLILYLRCKPDICYQRLQKRGRNEEKESIRVDYLEQLSKRHEQWLNGEQQKENRFVMLIEGDKEFESSVDRQQEIFKQIDSFFKLHNVI